MSRCYRWSVSCVAVVVMAAMGLVFAPSSSTAFPTWSTNGSDNCAGCHGDFRANNYTSLTSKDPVNWGTDLMDGHQSAFGIGGGSNCDVCHTGSDRSVVFIGSSDGAGGLAPLGCLGCHGRDEPGIGIDGAGLRKKHSFSNCNVCHSSDPATPINELQSPPYYINPGSGHTIPTHPCNLPGQAILETAFGSWGLDNDGNGLYDVAEDTSCAPLVAVHETTWGQIKALFE